MHRIARCELTGHNKMTECNFNAYSRDPNKSTSAFIVSVPFCPPRCDYLVPIYDFGKIDTQCVSPFFGFKIQKAVANKPKNIVDDNFPTLRKMNLV